MHMKQRLKFFFLFVVSSFSFCSFAQEDVDTIGNAVKVKENYFDEYLNEVESNKPGEGQVNIIQDYRIKSLVNKQIRIDDRTPGSAGYRIQIYFESGSQARTKANEVKSEFLTYYPDVAAYMSYEQPFFKIRVGDFRSMLEAQGFKNIIAASFPNAFIVSDRINGY